MRTSMAAALLLLTATELLAFQGVVVSDSARQIELLPTRVVTEAVAIYNAPGTTRFTGNSRIPGNGTIAGDVAVESGELTIAGHVRGRVVAVNATVILEPTARVDRDILVVGGAVGRRQNGRVRGDIRVYGARMLYTMQGDTIVPDPRYSDEGKWWSGLRVEGDRNRSKITVRGETYNRVEGLPILAGPSFRRAGDRFDTSVDILGILRTADRIRWDAENIGHRASFSMRMNTERGVLLGGALYDIVEPVENWHFSEHEVGLATFLLHRDFRDYYGRHGGALSLGLFRGFERELRIEYAHERWSSRSARDTWTLFRDSDPWRPNPAVHSGRMHVLSANLSVDTRNSEANPWTGWYAVGRLERGTGDLAPPDAPLAASRVKYSRLMVDARRYNRTSESAQLNLRLVYGARLGDDPLPLQKRFSVGGPGSLPGFDFRMSYGDRDIGMCSTGALLPGSPALCERVVLGQIEYRGDVHLDLFGRRRGGGGDWRDAGHFPEAQWVVFADAGRGWLVSTPNQVEEGSMHYPSGTVLPPLGTFRTDVGAGLDMGFAGVFIAKAVSQSGVPANFFVRLRHRF